MIKTINCTINAINNTNCLKASEEKKLQSDNE